MSGKNEIFAALDENYTESQEKSGMITPMPYSWIRRNEDGALIIYAPWRKHAEEIFNY